MSTWDFSTKKLLFLFDNLITLHIQRKCICTSTRNTFSESLCKVFYYVAGYDIKNLETFSHGMNESAPLTGQNLAYFSHYRLGWHSRNHRQQLIRGGHNFPPVGRIHPLQKALK